MIDATAARELKLFIVNDADLHRQQYVSILKNLATKKARGVYKHDLAVKLFGYLVQAGAKKYADTFEPTMRVWHQMFDAPTRRAVAEELTDAFEAEYKLGNYDQLLPKKYQKKEKASAPQHATKKGAKWKTPEGLAVRWAPVNNAWFVLWPTSAPLNKQQVLKIGPTEEIHDWLRDTYGPSYGLAGRASPRVHASCKRCQGGGCSSCGKARRRTPAQLERDIKQVLSARGGR